MGQFKRIIVWVFLILYSQGISLPIKSQAQPLSDSTAPVTEIFFNPPSYISPDNEIFISSITNVILDAKDPEIPNSIISGTATINYWIDSDTSTTVPFTYNIPFHLSEGTHTIHYQSVDNAGNYEETKSTFVYVDGTGPITMAETKGQPLIDGQTLYITTSDFIILNATDTESGNVASGNKAIFHIINLSIPPEECLATPYNQFAPPGTCENPPYQGPFTLNFGTYTVHYWSVDNVGNLGYISFINVDVGSAPAFIPYVSGIPLGISSITWTWQPVQGAAGYRIYSGEGQFLRDITNTEYVLTGLFPNTRYNVCVSAYNNYGETPPACETYIYTMADVPGVPYFTQVSSYSIQLGWSPASNPLYTVYQITLSTDGFVLNISPPVQVSYENYTTITGLAADTLYYARVQAYNGDGILTDFSEISSTKTLKAQLLPDITAPVTKIFFNPPSYISSDNKVFISSVTDIILAAKDPEIPDSIVLGTASINYWIDSDTSTTIAFTYSIPFQLSEATHTIYYQSIDNAGNYEQTKSTFVHVDGTPPVTIINIEPSYVLQDTTYYVPAGSTLTLSAYDPLSNNVNSGVKSIYYAVDFSSFTFSLPPLAFSLSVGTHTIHYFSMDNVGNQEIINLIFTEIGNPPSQVTGISGYALGISSIMWSWNSIENADGYRIYSETGAVLGSITTNYYVLKNLLPNINRYICVSAYNVYGESLTNCPSGIFTFANVPDKPYFTYVSSYSFKINWEAPLNPSYTGYQITISTDNFQLNFSTPVPITANHFEKYAAIAGLAPDTTYYARVQAYNGDGILTDFSEISSTKTLQAPPEPPVNINVIFSTATKSATVSWSAAPSGAPAVSFNVDRSKEPSPDSFERIVSGTTNFTYANYITETSTYYYRVTGINADGLESEPSIIVSVPADVNPPGDVSGFKVIGVDAETRKITLQWTAPSEDWGLDYYIIKSSQNYWTYTQWNDVWTLANVPASALPGATQSVTLILTSTDVVRYLRLKAVDDFGYESNVSDYAVAEFEPPSLIVISTVTPDSIVGRPFTTRITAQDNYRISKLEYLVDGNVVSSSAYNWQSLDTFYTWDTLNYSDGYHVFSVRVADFSNNKAEWNLPVIINYVPPLAPVITYPADNTKISTTTVIVGGNAEVNIYVSIFVNDTFITSVAADINGNFYAPDIPLPGDGVFSITCQSLDKKGSSPRSKPVSVIVDLGPPNPPQNLSAGSAKDGRVQLLWSLPDGEKPVSYNIYRSTIETGLIAQTTPYQSFLIASGITALEYSDLPPSNNIYYYGVTSIDGAKNESVLSNIAAAVSDRFGPSCSITLSSAPPIGAGNYLITITVSETLSFVPYLTFTPYGQSPVQLTLEPVTPVIWTATLTVTGDMISGTGAFSFSGTDLSGNTGWTITSGSSLEIETQGPEAIGNIFTDKPVLKVGSYVLNLNLNEPARQSPALSYITQSGSTTTILLSSSTNASVWTGQISIDTTTGEYAHDFKYFAYDMLGNKGELLLGTTYFIVDTIPTNPPISLNGTGGAGGIINLSWSAPSGEKPSFYCVYRDSVQTCNIVPKPEDLTGFYQDKPPEGSYTYVVTSLDAAGNESEVSNSTTTVSDSTPPAPPVITAYNALVELIWQPGSAETPARYRLYRSTYALISATGIPYRVIIGTSAQDSPESDGIYYYYVTALDSVGNESGLSNSAEISYDGAAPVIIISGVENGAYYNSSVVPVINIIDLSLLISTITLNSFPFVSGSTVSTEGTYTLAVSAQDISGHSSQKTVSFTIDKTSPAISFSGVQNNGYYEQAIAPVISASDLNLSTVSAALNGETFVSGSSIAAGGSYILKIDATDKAGNVSTLSISFTMNPPPAKPKNLSITIEDDKTAILTWESPAPDMVLYKVYKNNIYIGPAQITDLSFRDTFYSASTVCVYEVSAIDSKGREGEKARTEILPVSLMLAGYGTVVESNVVAGLVPAIKEALNRGFFDSIRFNIVNKSTQTLTIGPVVVQFIGPNVVAELALPNVSVNIHGFSSSEVSVPVYVSTSFANTVSIKAVVPLPPAGDAQVNLSKTFTLNIRNPLEPIVEIYPEALVRGTYSNVWVKFNNRGSAPIDVVTARLSGSKQVPSKTVAVELKALSGLVLSRAELSQTSGANIALVNNEQLYFVRIPGGSSFTFEPVRPAVPQETPEKLIVEGIVGGLSGAANNAPGLAYSIPSGVVYAPGIFVSSKTMATELAVPYTVTLYSDKSVYDKEMPVQLYGQFQDIWGNLLGGFPLSLTVTNKGYERRFDVVTDSSANYSVEFTPGPSEAGIFNVSARHPDFVGDAAFSSFSVVGMEFGYKEYTLTMAKNSSYTFDVDFTNTGETVLNNVVAQFIGLCSGGCPSTIVVAGLVPAIPSVITAGMRYKLPITVTADTNASDTAEFILKITESNGFERTMPLHIKTVPAQVLPKATPQMFEIGMLAGEIRTQVIMVENVGFSTWTNVQVTTPTLPWVRIDGLQNKLGDIGPGKNAYFVLIFEPPANQTNARYTENKLVEIIGGGATVPINVGITITSSRRGAVYFNVASADIPSTNPTGRLGNADVRLTSIDISGLIFTVKTDSNGLARFEDIPSGKYVYKAEISGYNPVAGMIEIEPGLNKVVDIFMPTTMVTYKWSVTPTLITDKYDITVDMTFRTDVPAPVIVINPPLITLNMQAGETAYAQYTIKNEGLVSVVDFELKLEGSDAIKIELPFTIIPEIKAGQVIVVPIKITLVHASCPDASIKHKGRYVCIAGVWTWVEASDVRIMAGGTCPSGPVSWAQGPGGGWGGPLVFGGGSSANIAAMNKDVVLDMGCGTICLEGTRTGCDPCTICFAGECRPDTSQDNQPCGKAENICKKKECKSGICTEVDNSAETNDKVERGEINMSDCPNRVAKDPSTYTPTTNGCGAQDKGLLEIPDIPDPFCGFSFKDACDKHDVCYGICNNNKTRCDLALGLNAAQVCNFLNPFCMGMCLEWSGTYSAMVMAFGKDAYKNGQKQGCERCCP